MADTHDGGGFDYQLPILMYESLRELVYADDPGEVRAVGEWLLGRGRELASFAAALFHDLAEVDAVYSSEYGAPALIRQLKGTITETQNVADALLNNGHTMLAAADAIQAARREVDAVRTAPDTDGDGRTATWRTGSPYTDGPTLAARPYVKALNNHLYNLSDNINLLGAEPDKRPGPGPGGGSPESPPGSAGMSALPGASPRSPGMGPAGLPASRPPGGTAPGGPAPGGVPVVPGSGRVPSGSTRSPVGGPDGVPGGSGSRQQRLRVPGARSGDLLGRLGSSGTGATGVGGGAPGGAAAPGKGVGGPGGMGGPGVPARPGSMPPGGGPGHPVGPGHGIGHGVPPGGPGGRAGQDRAGRKKPGYERAEPDTFVDGRRVNAVGGEIRRATQPRRTDPSQGVIGSQKHAPTEEERASEWELPPAAAPAVEGLPDQMQEGSFRGSNGVQFDVRRRSRGR